MALPAGPGRSIVAKRSGDSGGEFDPFDEPLNDADAAMPAADGEFDPFEAPTTAREFAGRPPAEAGSPGSAVAEPMLAPPGAGEFTVRPPAEAGSPETYDVQQEFDEPRTGAVGPGVENELEEAGEAVQQEIDRRGGRQPLLPGDGQADPFSPGDALDAPRRTLPTGDADAAPADDSAAGDVEIDDGSDETQDGDIEEQFQQAPGGFQFRQLDQPGLTPEQQEARRQALAKEQAAATEDCERMVEAVAADDIKTVSLDIRTTGQAGEDYPFDCALGQVQYQPRSWAQITYLWKAAGLCHKPLYFEQVQLERYGHSWSPVLQPLLCGAHFFGTLPLLPYKMGIETPNECVYTLGYYRPGSCAPYMIEAVPFTWRAVAFEGAAWTTGVLVFP